MSIGGRLKKDKFKPQKTELRISPDIQNEIKLLENIVEDIHVKLKEKDSEIHKLKINIEMSHKTIKENEMIVKKYTLRSNVRHFNSYNFFILKYIINIRYGNHMKRK